jgi:UDPglucose--hexose-1-phosphate uridylyltransferase
MGAQFPGNKKDSANENPETVRQENEFLKDQVEAQAAELKSLRAKMASLQTEVSLAKARVADLEAQAGDSEGANKDMAIRRRSGLTVRRATVGQGVLANNDETFDRRLTRSLTRRQSSMALVKGTVVTPLAAEDNHYSFTQRGEEHASDEAIAHGIQCFWQRLKAQGDATDEFRVIRQNIFNGRWTLYTAGGQHSKPRQYVQERLTARADEQPTHEPRCPFCVGNEYKTPDPLLYVDKDGVFHMAEEGLQCPEGWQVRVIPNIFPILITPPGAYGEAFSQKLATIPHSAVAAGKHTNHKISGALGRNRRMMEGDATSENSGKFQVDAVGYSEVIIESSRHNALLGIAEPEKVSLSWRAMQIRGKWIRDQPGVRQLLYFKQYGALSGGSLVHPHMQIVSLPLATPEHVGRMRRCRDYYHKHHKCSVCNCLVNEPLGKGAASSRLIHASEHFVAVVPFASRQYRVSIVPRVHGHSWLDASPEVVLDLARVLQLVMEVMFHSLDDPEYNLYLFSADVDATDNQTKASVHWLLEVHPRFPADLGGIELASGIRVISGLPEDMAVELREGVVARLKTRKEDMAVELREGVVARLKPSEEAEVCPPCSTTASTSTPCSNALGAQVL